MLRAGGAGRSPAGSPPPPPPPLAISHFLLPSRPEGGKKKKKKGLRGRSRTALHRRLPALLPPSSTGLRSLGTGGGGAKSGRPPTKHLGKKAGASRQRAAASPCSPLPARGPTGGLSPRSPPIGPHHRPTCSGPGAAAGRAPRPSAGSARPAPPPRTAGSRRQEAAPRHPALLHFSPSTVPKGPRGSPGLPTPPPGLPTLPPPFLGAPRSLLIKPRVPPAFLLHSLLGCFGAFGPKILSPCEAPGSRCQPESLVGCWVVV